jgi:hypothetical protein
MRIHASPPGAKKIAEIPSPDASITRFSATWEDVPWESSVQRRERTLGAAERPSLRDRYGGNVAAAGDSW